MKPPLHRLTFIGLLGLTALVSRLPAAVPQSLAEAEGFARELIEKHLHHRQGVLTTDNLKKMKIQRNDAGTATTFFLPRGTRSSPDFVIEVVMSPTNAPLSPGHMIAHASVQRHRYADYADASPLATQSEQYDRTIACLGPEAACVSLSAEKRRADDFGVLNHLELAWLPVDQRQFGIVIRLRNLQLNLLKEGRIGSDAFHTMVDKRIAPLILGLARAAQDADFISSAHAAATETFYHAVMTSPHHGYDSPAYTGPATVPRPLTLAAYRATAPVSPPVASSAPSTPPTASANANIVWLEPPEVAQLTAQYGLVAFTPQPTPSISLILPREATTPASRGTAFEKSTLLALLLDPDLRLKITKERAGFSATVYVLAKADWAAVVVETEEGFHLPVITLKRDFPDACAAFLKLGAPRGESQPAEFRLSPVRLAVLRTLFELHESTRTLAGSEVSDLAAYSLKEIMTLYASPRMLSLVEALPGTAQWDVQAVAGNDLLLILELTALRQQRLLTRNVVNGAPVYRLSPDGLLVSRELFTPPERILVTRVPDRLIDTTPSVHLTNIAAFVGPHTAFLRHLPNGEVRYLRAPWRGGPSIWDLFAGLTEPES